MGDVTPVVLSATVTRRNRGVMLFRCSFYLKEQTEEVMTAVLAAVFIT